MGNPCDWDLGSVADWIVAVAALVAIYVAWNQLHAAALAARDQAEIARASLILEIDRDFESQEMQESRLALRGLRNEIESFVSSGNRAMEKEALNAECNRQFSIYLNRLWDNFRRADEPPATAIDAMIETHLAKMDADPTRIEPHERAGLHYQRLTRVLGWLERVGHMANQSLLPEGDMITLYDFVFIELGDWFEGHVRYRCEDGTRANPDFMKEMREFRGRIIAQRQASPILPSRKWGLGVSGFRAIRKPG